MPICTCPCPLHSQEGASAFDVDAFWSSVTGGSPRLDNSPARLVFMGDGRVGTTSLIKRFTRGLFEPDYRPEIAKVMRHTRTVYTSRLDTSVTVQFWDIEGSDVRTSLLCAQKAHAVAVVYEITNRSSFELAQRLLEGVNPRASVLLIAHKIDLKVHRKVSYHEGRLLAKIHRVHYLEVSAKLNEKVDEAFNIMVNSVPDEYLKNGSRDSKAMRAIRRWQVSTTLCVACHSRLPGAEGGGERERESSEDRGAVGVRQEKSRLRPKHRSASEDRPREASGRRRVISDPEFARSMKEKAISI